MSDREEFEKWVERTAREYEYAIIGSLLKRDGDTYATTWVDMAWMGWQAARATDAEPVGYTWDAGRFGRQFTADSDSISRLSLDGVDLEPVYTHPPANGGPESE